MTDEVNWICVIIIFGVLIIIDAIIMWHYRRNIIEFVREWSKEKL